MRGGASSPAARLLWTATVGACVPVLALAQSPVRTRDVGFATVSYDNGQTFGALTLNETLVLERPTGSIVANGLVSLFDDGKWSMQGFLAGSRFSAPMAPNGTLGKWFGDLRGELSFLTATTAQQDLMPTLQFTGQTRMHLSSSTYGTRFGAAVARTFDGIGWRTTVMGEAAGWWQLTPRTVVSLTSTPMQLQFGDLMSDNETTVSWTRGRTTFDASLGVRLGEAARGTEAWGHLTASWPVGLGMFATVSLGTYPIDLIQGLPGGRYVAFAFRLPDGRFPALRRPRPVVPPPPVRPDLPTTEPLALVIGPALDSLEIREIRVWAPGVRRVELMADFVDWVPVPLVRQANGEWQGYYHVRAGLHRLNLRLDGRELAVPRNLARERDEFIGDVGLIVVR
jgi:hypothetical protein